MINAFYSFFSNGKEKGKPIENKKRQFHSILLVLMATQRPTKRQPFIKFKDDPNKYRLKYLSN